jgi:hypothetical protein
MQIHLLDTRAVEKELLENRLSETSQATYLAVGWIFYIIMGYSTVVYSNAS